MLPHLLARPSGLSGRSLISESLSTLYVQTRQGAWVHLHVMRSLYDERSSHLDINTGAPKDTKYE